MATSRTTTSSSEAAGDFRQLADRHLSLDKDLDEKCLSDVPSPGKECSNTTSSTVHASVQENVEAQLDPEITPDGGWRAWLTLLGVVIVQFTSFGYINAYGVYQDFYVRIFLTEKTSSQISWIGSTQLSLVLGMGLVTGIAFDKGYYYHLMLGGTFLITLSLFMLSLCQPQQFYAVFLSHGLGLGFGSGLTYVPSVSLVSHYFTRRRTLAYGISSAGSSLGSLFYPILLNRLLHGSVGFHNGVRVTATLNFGLLATAMVLMKPRLPPTERENMLPKIQKFIRDPAYMTAVAAGFFQLLGIYFPIFFFQLYAIKHRIDHRYAFLSGTILYSGNLVGRLVPNMLANRFGVINLTALSMALCGCLVFVMLGIRDVTGLIAFGLLFGFFAGACFSLFPPSVATLSDDVAEIGARLGFSIGFGGLPGLIGAPAAGALLSVKYLWFRPIVVAAACLLIGSTCMAFSRYFYMRKQAEQKANLQIIVSLGGHPSSEQVVHSPGPTTHSNSPSAGGPGSGVIMIVLSPPRFHRIPDVCFWRATGVEMCDRDCRSGFA